MADVARNKVPFRLYCTFFIPPLGYFTLNTPPTWFLLFRPLLTFGAKWEKKRSLSSRYWLRCSKKRIFVALQSKWRQVNSLKFNLLNICHLAEIADLDDGRNVARFFSRHQSIRIQVIIHRLSHVDTFRVFNSKLCHDLCVLHTVNWIR